MGNFLDRFRPPTSSANLPAQRPASALPQGYVPEKARGLGKAAVVYGAAAAGLMVLGIFYLFTGAWFTGLLLLIPAACLAGFAWVYTR